MKTSFPKIIYEEAAITEQEMAERLEKAFNVLFEATLMARQYENENRTETKIR